MKNKCEFPVRKREKRGGRICEGKAIIHGKKKEKSEELSKE